MSGEELQYTRIEISSFLPTGWSLPDGEGEGHWDEETNRWSVTLLDGSDLEWPLVVDGKEASANGRLEALRRATRRVYLRS